MTLPKAFGPAPSAELWDVEGTPVACNWGGWPICAAFDWAEPRPFPHDSASRNGAPIAEAGFRVLVKCVHAGT